MPTLSCREADFVIPSRTPVSPKAFMPYLNQLTRRAYSSSGEATLDVIRTDRLSTRGREAEPPDRAPIGLKLREPAADSFGRELR